MFSSPRTCWTFDGATGDSSIHRRQGRQRQHAVLCRWGCPGNQTDEDNGKAGFICFFSHCLHFHLPYLFHVDHDSVRRRQHGAGAQLRSRLCQYGLCVRHWTVSLRSRSHIAARPVFCGTAARARRPAFWNAVISINNFLYYFLNIYIYPRALRALRALPGSPGSRLRSLRALPGSPGLSVRGPGSPRLSARSFYPGLSIFLTEVG